jgi:hypothetical protein
MVQQRYNEKEEIFNGTTFWEHWMTQLYLINIYALKFESQMINPTCCSSLFFCEDASTKILLFLKFNCEIHYINSKVHHFN